MHRACQHYVNKHHQFIIYDSHKKNGRDIFLVVPSRPADVSPPANSFLASQEKTIPLFLQFLLLSKQAVLAFPVSCYLYYSQLWLNTQVSKYKYI